MSRSHHFKLIYEEVKMLLIVFGLRLEYSFGATILWLIASFAKVVFGSVIRDTINIQNVIIYNI